MMFKEIYNIFVKRNLQTKAAIVSYTISSEPVSALEPLGNALHINFKINNTI